jgi:drug/metabolite transporter (DMT)-like permease
VSRRTVAHLALAGAALLFGTTFVVIKEAVEILPPMSFVGWRFLLGAAVLFTIARPRGTLIWRHGAIAGVSLLAGYAFQTWGLSLTSASNSGLITGLYVVFTPLIAAASFRRRPHALALGGGVLAFAGLAFLTVEHGLTLRRGDLLTVACAVAFAVHIVILSRLAPLHPIVAFTAVQLLVVSVGAMALAVIEGFTVPGLASLPALLATGLVVSAGAFLIQVWAQTVIGPSRTAVVLALEPAFAAATAAVVLGERLDLRGWIGAGLILLGIYVVVGFTPDELPEAESVSAAH